MSEARMRVSHVGGVSPASARTIASVYGSSPLEHAADHRRSRCLPPRSAAFRHVVVHRPVTYSKWCGSPNESALCPLLALMNAVTPPAPPPSESLRYSWYSGMLAVPMPPSP